MLISSVAGRGGYRTLELPFEEQGFSDANWGFRGVWPNGRREWTPEDSPWREDAWEPFPGPDGRVAVALPGHVLCYDAQGRKTWHFKRNGVAAARAVEGGLLVDHDGSLFFLDWGGTFHPLWGGPSPLTAQPLFHEGSWFVATQEGLHRLDPA